MMKLPKGARVQLRRSWEHWLEGYAQRMEHETNGQVFKRARMNEAMAGDAPTLYHLLASGNERTLKAWLSYEALEFMRDNPRITWQSMLESAQRDLVDEHEQASDDAVRRLMELRERLDSLGADLAAARASGQYSWKDLEEVTGMTRATLAAKVKAYEAAARGA